MGFTLLLFAVFFHLTDPKSNNPQFSKLISALLPIFVIEIKAILMAVAKLKKVNFK